VREGLGKTLNQLWPNVTAAGLVKKVLSSKSFLQAAAVGVMSSEECEEILETGREILSGNKSRYPELVLLDEANFLIGGEYEKFGHVILDEAQDRSPMELRAIGRRAIKGSMTILGDLAQGTSSNAIARWSDLIDYVEPESGSHVVELTHGYRVPSSIMEIANNVLRIALPGLRPTESVRQTGDAPQLVEVAESDLDSCVMELTQELAQEFSLVSVIAPASLIDQLKSALNAAAIGSQDKAKPNAINQITLLTPKQAKGLEFDAVVVVEPQKIIDEEPGAEKALYVALTRAVQRLAMVTTSNDVLAVLGMKR
jgi:DNA helicase IV